MIHKEPQPRGSINKLVRTYGWPDEENRLSFRHTFGGKSTLGFYITDSDHKIFINNDKFPELKPYWEHNVLLNRLAAKLSRLILVRGTVSKDKRQVIYESAYAYWDLDLRGLVQSIVDGTFKIDFDARTKTATNNAIRNHGTKLRIHIDDVAMIYENSQLID